MSSTTSARYQSSVPMAPGAITLSGLLAGVGFAVLCSVVGLISAIGVRPVGLSLLVNPVN